MTIKELIEDIKILIEDYNRRIVTINQMLATMSPKKATARKRLLVKKGTYQIFLTELKRLLHNNV